MVLLTYRQIRRIRTGSMLCLFLAVLVLIAALRSASGGGQLAQLGGLLVGVLAVVALSIAGLQLFVLRGPSKAILVQQPDEMVIATNQLHDGYKLRFFRDMLNDKLTQFADEEREEWAGLASEGFHAVFKVRHARKTELLPMLCLLFDQVYVLDHTNRWDYFDCQNSSEPTRAVRGVSPLRNESLLPQSKRQPAV